MTKVVLLVLTPWSIKFDLFSGWIRQFFKSKSKSLQVLHFKVHNQKAGWTGMDRDGPEWTGMDWDGLGWTGMDQDGLGGENVTKIYFSTEFGKIFLPSCNGSIVWIMSCSKPCRKCEPACKTGIPDFDFGPSPATTPDMAAPVTPA